MKKPVLVLLPLAAVAGISDAQGGTVQLKNGRELTGRVMDINATSVVIRVDGGEVILARRNITSVTLTADDAFKAEGGLPEEKIELGATREDLGESDAAESREVAAERREFALGQGAELYAPYQLRQGDVAYRLGLQFAADGKHLPAYDKFNEASRAYVRSIDAALRRTRELENRRRREEELKAHAEARAARAQKAMERERDRERRKLVQEAQLAEARLGGIVLDEAWAKKEQERIERITRAADSEGSGRATQGMVDADIQAALRQGSAPQTGPGATTLTPGRTAARSEAEQLAMTTSRIGGGGAWRPEPGMPVLMNPPSRSSGGSRSTVPTSEVREVEALTARADLESAILALDENITDWGAQADEIEVSAVELRTVALSKAELDEKLAATASSKIVTSDAERARATIAASSEALAAAGAKAAEADAEASRVRAATQAMAATRDALVPLRQDEGAVVAWRRGGGLPDATLGHAAPSREHAEAVKSAQEALWKGRQAAMALDAEVARGGSGQPGVATLPEESRRRLTLAELEAIEHAKSRHAAARAGDPSAFEPEATPADPKLTPEERAILQARRAHELAGKLGLEPSMRPDGTGEDGREGGFVDPLEPRRGDPAVMREPGTPTADEMATAIERARAAHQLAAWNAEGLEPGHEATPVARRTDPGEGRPAEPVPTEPQPSDEMVAREEEIAAALARAKVIHEGGDPDAEPEPNHEPVATQPTEVVPQEDETPSDEAMAKAIEDAKRAHELVGSAWRASQPEPTVVDEPGSAEPSEAEIEAALAAARASHETPTAEPSQPEPSQPEPMAEGPSEAEIEAALAAARAAHKVPTAAPAQPEPGVVDGPAPVVVDQPADEEGPSEEEIARAIENSRRAHEMMGGPSAPAEPVAAQPDTAPEPEPAGPSEAEIEAALAAARESHQPIAQPEPAPSEPVVVAEPEPTGPSDAEIEAALAAARAAHETAPPAPAQPEPAPPEPAPPEPMAAVDEGPSEADVSAALEQARRAHEASLAARADEERRRSEEASSAQASAEVTAARARVAAAKEATTSALLKVAASSDALEAAATGLAGPVDASAKLDVAKEARALAQGQSTRLIATERQVDKVQGLLKGAVEANKRVADVRSARQRLNEVAAELDRLDQSEAALGAALGDGSFAALTSEVEVLSKRVEQTAPSAEELARYQRSADLAAPLYKQMMTIVAGMTGMTEADVEAKAQAAAAAKRGN